VAMALISTFSQDGNKIVPSFLYNGIALRNEGGINRAGNNKLETALIFNHWKCLQENGFCSC
jgi:hypothetical protein